MNEKLRNAVKKSIPKELRRRIWSQSKTCPFKTNRGFEYDDEHCQECGDAEVCLESTQRRLLGILYGFKQDIGFPWALHEQPYEDEEYFHIHLGEVDQTWLQEKRNDIRKAAHWLIENDVDPENGIHPNTRKYFQNCFPEWNKYEEEVIKREFIEGLQNFHREESDKAYRYPPYEKKIDDYDREDIESFLISMGDWRGFPFDDLIGQNPNIPEKNS